MMSGVQKESGDSETNLGFWDRKQRRGVETLVLFQTMQLIGQLQIPSYGSCGQIPGCNPLIDNRIVPVQILFLSRDNRPERDNRWASRQNPIY